MSVIKQVAEGIWLDAPLWNKLTSGRIISVKFQYKGNGFWEITTETPKPSEYSKFEYVDVDDLI